MSNKKPVISYQAILGDSLTDGGALQQGKPFLASATALPRSPYGRFTDGITWADDLARSAALDIVKEQFIQYIINAIQPEKLEHAEMEISKFKDYIHAINLDKFHPDTFSFEKLKDSYLKRHLLKQNIIAYFSDLFHSQSINKDQEKEFMDFLRFMNLENFHPDEFDLYEIMDDFQDSSPIKNQFITSLDGIIDDNSINETIQKCKNTYKTTQTHYNNIFDAIDYNKFSVKHINENLKNILYGSFSLGNYQRILFQGHNFVRRFAEGGLSAKHYWPIPDLHTLSQILQQIKYDLGEFNLSFQYLSNFVSQFFVLLGRILGARAMLSHLDEKADSLLKDDEEQNISQEEKNKTLVTEWTGGNDFFTMNALCSEKICDDAIQARMDNILKLAKGGYSNFLLIDLPDLGKTPRYLNRSAAERDEVTRLIKYFNQKLRDEMKTIAVKNPKLNIQLFPISECFDSIYNDPEAYGLSPNIDKVNPLLSFDPEDANKDGYIFWDEVHPSNMMHHVLAQEVHKFCKENYNLQTPEHVGQPCCPVNIVKGLLVMFKDEYSRSYGDFSSQLVNGFSRFFGLGTYKQNFSNVNFAPENLEQARQSLAELYQLSNQDKIVKQSLVDMGWIQKDGQLPKNGIAPVLEQAYEIAKRASASKESQNNLEVLAETRMTFAS